jgi:uncharacterized membrane protein
VKKSRLEAFSDGVLAIVITIMVLELKVPHDASLEGLRPLLPKALSYILSFTMVGIYWNNHHHLFHAIEHVNGRVLWANLHLLFWISLLPFATAWMGENAFAAWPVALYGGILFMAGVSYTLLTQSLVKLHGRDSVLATAVGRDVKAIVSLCLYIVAIAASAWKPWLAVCIYVLVVMLWFVPDMRIERRLAETRD